MSLISNTDCPVNGRKFEIMFAGRSGESGRLPYVGLYPGIRQVVSVYDDNGIKPMPRTVLAGGLFQRVKAFVPRAIGKSLCLYDSLGMPVDQHQGVDGFFAVWGCVVTFDLSARKKKKEEIKADLLIGPDEVTIVQSSRALALHISSLLTHRVNNGKLVYLR